MCLRQHIMGEYERLNPSCAEDEEADLDITDDLEPLAFDPSRYSSRKERKSIVPSSWRSWLVWVQPLCILFLSGLLAVVTYRDTYLFHARCHRSIAAPCKPATRSTSSFVHCSRNIRCEAPLLEATALDEYETVFFNGSLNFDSPFKGPPSDVVDARWHSIIYGTTPKHGLVHVHSSVQTLATSLELTKQITGCPFQGRT